MKEYTLNEIAQMLKVSRQRVHQYIQAGELRARRVGKLVLVVDESDLKQFLKRRENKTKAKNNH